MAAPEAPQDSGVHTGFAGEAGQRHRDSDSGTASPGLLWDPPDCGRHMLGSKIVLAVAETAAAAAAAAAVAVGIETAVIAVAD